MNYCELTASITAIANILADKYNDEELSLLASIFVQRGDTLATIVAGRAVCEKIILKNEN